MERALYTEKRQDRIKRDKAIAKSFTALKKKYPDSTLERIFVEIAKDYDITTAAIRAICKKSGVC